MTVAATTVTVETLANALGLDGDGGDQAERVAKALASTADLVDPIFAQAFKDVPESVVDEVYLEVGMEMFKRTDAPGGQSQYVTPENGNVVRGPRDPLNRSYPIIHRYVMPF